MAAVSVAMFRPYVGRADHEILFEPLVAAVIQLRATDALVYLVEREAPKRSVDLRLNRFERP